MSDDFNKFDENEEEIKKKIEEIDLENDKKYSENYSENDFWDKIKKYAKKAGLNVICYALTLYYVLMKLIVFYHVALLALHKDLNRRLIQCVANY